ncbi:MAG: hypothetical protein H6Q90_5530 [Deltaproteobacteria bacterium]|nr:hypothetical protein [Deltaproteobacteria bacterium]
MAKKRPRTERRIDERAARQLVRDREKLAALVAGGSAERPIHVDSASVVEVRVRALACPQCEGEYRLIEHRAPASGLREVSVICNRCHVPRTLWFKLVSRDPS